MSWIFWIAIVSILVAVILFFKFKTTNHKMKEFLAISFILILTVSLLYVYISSGADLRSFDGVVGFGRAYFSWVGSVFHNFISITGYAIMQDWGTNSTRIAG